MDREGLEQLEQLVDSPQLAPAIERHIGQLERGREVAGRAVELLEDILAATQENHITQGELQFNFLQLQSF